MEDKEPNEAGEPTEPKELKNAPNTALTPEAVNELSPSEKTELIAYHREQLKLLHSVPRSDWHREFERIFRSDARIYGDDVVIRAEEELGIDPPRVDYLVLDDMKRLMSGGKSIFRIFRQHNIIEYKNPNDALNERVISKAIGYANLYIGLAEHKDDRPRNEVSISIFRESRNDGLFRTMLTDGTLEATDVDGIYKVLELTDLPMQIVVIGELKGEEYAAYRLLSEHADEKDVEIVAEKIRCAQTPDEQENGQRLMEFVENKNPGIMRRAIGGDEDMASILMDVLEPEIKTVVNNAVNNTTRTNLYLYVQDGDMMLENAARRAGITTEAFRTEMTAHGYHLPQGQTV